MDFPPDCLNDGRVQFYATQDARCPEKAYLTIKVFDGSGSAWVCQVPEVFSSLTDALQYAKQWIYAFKLRRTTP
jgi:hypothetical protein